MKVVNEKKVGKEYELQFELTADEYEMLYEYYLKEKELKEDSENYSFDDYFQELIDLVVTHFECEMMEKELEDKRQELKEQEKVLRFMKGKLQAKIDGNNA